MPKITIDERNKKIKQDIKEYQESIQDLENLKKSSKQCNTNDIYTKRIYHLKQAIENLQETLKATPRPRQ